MGLYGDGGGDEWRWTLLDAANSSCSLTCPQPRYAAEGAWDGQAGQLILFGGDDSAQSILSDTWSWSPSGQTGGTWTQQNSPSQPTGRANGAVAFDSTHGMVVLGPGLSLASGDVDDAWSYVQDQRTWQQLPVATSTAPPVRQLTTWVWDDVNACFLLFGGRVTVMGAANDLWELCPSAPVSIPTAMPTTTALAGVDVGQPVDNNATILLPPSMVITATQAGTRYIRLNFILGNATSWSDTNLLSAYDSIVNTYLAAGIQILGLVTAQATTDGSQADWTANNAENNAGANGDNSFISTTYVQDALQPLIAHFHDRITLWELWNEPNSYQSCSGMVCSGGSFIYPSNFAALLADSYTAIKDPAPTGLGLSDVTLISGGLLGHSIGGALTATNAGATYLIVPSRKALRRSHVGNLRGVPWRPLSARRHRAAHLCRSKPADHGNRYLDVLRMGSRGRGDLRDAPAHLSDGRRVEHDVRAAKYPGRKPGYPL